ncbi:MAG: trigger factor [Planctomycetota bacterium]
MAEATENPIKIDITDAGACQKTIKVEVPAEYIDEKLSGSVDTIASEAALPGFRKGRAPRRLIEKRFGSSIRDETRQQLVSEAYRSAVDDHKLEVVGEPDGSALADLEIEEGKPLSFEIGVEVAPTFELPELEGFEVKKPTFEIGDDVVDSEVEKICINEGELEEREAPEPGDYVTGKGVMVDGEGTEHYNIDGAVVRVPEKDGDGKGMILGVVVEDFSKQFGLPKPGETATVKVKGPENHEVEAIRGADLSVSFEVSRVDRIIPISTEDAAKRFGMPGADELKSAVRQRIEQRAMTEQQVAMRRQVADKLIGDIEFELPERLTEGQAARNLERRRMELMYRGVDPTEIEEHIAEMRAASSDAAQRELKLFFIMNKAAEKLSVSVQEAELNGAIAQMAIQRGERPEKMRDELIRSGRAQMLYSQLREHKTLDAILAKAKIEEMPAEDFNKMLSENN